MSNYLGRKLEIVSKTKNCYIGVLEEINQKTKELLLRDVVCYGAAEKPNTATETHPFVLFKREDIDSVHVEAPRKEETLKQPPTEHGEKHTKEWNRPRKTHKVFYTKQMEKILEQRQTSEKKKRPEDAADLSTDTVNTAPEYLGRTQALDSLLSAQKEEGGKCYQKNVSFFDNTSTQENTAEKEGEVQ
ncbi:MAG: uncharacterized protein A8A55_1686 [Amphiamblys sp. WSBS2006]|nr:MAG: uncharacterized protein A8A55_1686 [Amphiamblys sp. WSBS2006]